MNETHDIVILGGGLVGLSTLLALPATLQARTLLLDAAPAPDLKKQLAPPGLDDRGTALNRRSLDILHTFGVLQDMTTSIGDIRHIEVSQADHWGITELSAEDQPWGAVANNRLLGHALAHRANATSAEMRHECRVERVSMHGDHANIKLDTGETVEARLVILADGGRSGIAAQLGISHRHHDYQQVAFTMNIERERPADDRAYERFSEQGPRALLPLDGCRQTVVWVVRGNQAERVNRWPESTWKRAIVDCFGFDQGQVTAVSARSQYPLVMSRATEMARHRLAIVGNGALTLHPVAGQGFNLHLRSLFDLASRLDPADPGRLDNLLAWQRRTESAQQQVAMACHGLVSLFAHTHPVARHARGLGLFGFNAAAGLKARLGRRAMGYH